MQKGLKVHVMGSLFAATAATDRAGWSDDSKQNAAAMMRNMCCKLCNDRDATQLIAGLDVRSMAYMGTDGNTSLYHCGKCIFSQVGRAAHHNQCSG